MKKILIAFDIDGTLRDNTVDQMKAPVANERIRTLLITLASMKNVDILVWSGGGEFYARQIVAAFALEKYVDKYGDKKYKHTLDGIMEFHPDLKPDIAFDDIHDCELGVINLIVNEK